MNVKDAKKKLRESLMAAREVWDSAGMSQIYDGHSDETGKVALAILAGTIFNATRDE